MPIIAWKPPTKMAPPHEPLTLRLSVRTVGNFGDYFCIVNLLNVKIITCTCICLTWKYSFLVTVQEKMKLKKPKQKDKLVEEDVSDHIQSNLSDPEKAEICKLSTV